MSVTFSDLPLVVLGLIVDKLDLHSCLVLRKVSRDLRNVVDNANMSCDEISLFVDSKRIGFSDQLFEYRQVGRQKKLCRLMTREKKHPFRTLKEKQLHHELGPLKLMMGDLTRLLGNPKLKIGNFKVCMKDQSSRATFNAFLETPHQIQANKVTINMSHPLVSHWIPRLLQKLDSNGVASIEVNWFFMASDPLDEVTELFDLIREKQVPILRINGVPDAFKLESLTLFTQVYMDDLGDNEERLFEVREVLRKSNTLDCLCAGTRRKMEDIVRFMRQDTMFDSRTRRFSIPNSSDYFQMFVKSEKMLAIFRMPPRSPLNCIQLESYLQLLLDVIRFVDSPILARIERKVQKSIEDYRGSDRRIPAVVFKFFLDSIQDLADQDHANAETTSSSGFSRFLKTQAHRLGAPDVVDDWLQNCMMNSDKEIPVEGLCHALEDLLKVTVP